MSSSLQPHGLQPASLLCPWDSPGNHTEVDCQALFQGIFQTQGSNLCLSCLLDWQAGSLPLSEWGSEVAQLCPTLWPHGRWLQGSSVHRIFQERALEWIAISFSRGSSRPRDRTQVSCIAGRRFTLWATREAPLVLIHSYGITNKESQCGQDTQQRQLEWKPWKYKFLDPQKI